MLKVHEVPYASPQDEKDFVNHAAHIYSLVYKRIEATES